MLNFKTGARIITILLAVDVILHNVGLPEYLKHMVGIYLNNPTFFVSVMVTFFICYYELLNKLKQTKIGARLYDLSIICVTNNLILLAIPIAILTYISALLYIVGVAYLNVNFLALIIFFVFKMRSEKNKAQ